MLVCIQEKIAVVFLELNVHAAQVKLAQPQHVTLVLAGDLDRELVGERFVKPASDIAHIIHINVRILMVFITKVLLSFEIDISSNNVDHTELGVLDNLNVRPV